MSGRRKVGGGGENGFGWGREEWEGVFSTLCSVDPIHGWPQSAITPVVWSIRDRQNWLINGGLLGDTACWTGLWKRAGLFSWSFFFSFCRRLWMTKMLAEQRVADFILKQIRRNFSSIERKGRGGGGTDLLALLAMMSQFEGLITRGAWGWKSLPWKHRHLSLCEEKIWSTIKEKKSEVLTHENTEVWKELYKKRTKRNSSGSTLHLRYRPSAAGFN